MRLRPVLLLLLAACAEPLPDLPTDSATVAALNAVRARLIGPQSARFRGVKAMTAALYCGEVAARNAAGEYIGWRPFAVVQGRALLAPDSLPAECR